jgi:hypothetical protein
MEREQVVQVFMRQNDIAAINNRIARIDAALKGNLISDMYAWFHFGPRVASKAPESKRPDLESERERLRLMREQKQAEIQMILDADTRRTQALEEVAEILKTYPIIGGAE